MCCTRCLASLNNVSKISKSDLEYVPRIYRLNCQRSDVHGAFRYERIDQNVAEFAAVALRQR